MKISIEKLDELLDFIDLYRADGIVLVNSSIQLPEDLAKVKNGKIFTVRRGYKFISFEQVNNFVVTGGSYPLDGQDLDIDSHVFACRSIHLIKEKSTGKISVIKDSKLEKSYERVDRDKVKGYQIK